MGACFSKKNNEVSSSPSLKAAAAPASQPVLNHHISTNNATLKVDQKNEITIKNKIVEQKEVVTKQVVEEEEEEDSLLKKEIFVIKHRKSHYRDKCIPPPNDDGPAANANASAAAAGEILMANSNTNVVLIVTSSCTKEEVDAILIRCGRLSRSNSSGAGKPLSSGRKYSGSKRSYDFDNNNDQDQDVKPATSADYDSRRKGNDDDEGEVTAERRQHRQRQSSRPSASPSAQGRRRTPSRERDQNQRSGSRERASGSSGRRVSRSPGRRSEIAQNTSITPGNPNATIPANNTGGAATTLELNRKQRLETKRISVKRNVGEAAVAGSRTAASPRSQSPARANAKTSNENNQQPCLSRSNSRKADQSPYRRNPLSEIDPIHYSIHNHLATRLPAPATTDHKSETKILKDKRVNVQVANYRCSSMASLENKLSKEQQLEEAKGHPPVTTNVVDLGGESLKPQALTRSRSARRSRDLDLNPETLLNSTPSYTALLLEDIQNFHQKNTPPSFSLPACVTKACSILEVVADLNSTTSSNLSCAFSDDRISPPAVAAVNLVGKKLPEAKDPFVESEVIASDDLMEPSFHKYVTVRRGGGTLCGEDMDGQESSGNFVGGSQQNLGLSTSSWEPNSADSTDRWSSRSNTRDEDDKSPLGYQKHGLPETGRDVEQARRAFSGQRTGIGRGRLGTSKNAHTTPILATATQT
ncbi:LOW QUALITY PROTEIN: hypothetical protein NC653_022284 [Populus alba x Populus x berolinensis]|uniref:Uncharacterized protein n=1 Tax=Populus alba x Populus x berolinensis TaxID=444605 RepID=A0AAD6MEF1_9ROSI|nr:LOW QUALITY PROTEIN: hypothetical protein NC653_022284 [Populus alba x Populus x berolinensis]